jgi:hypothetical protein
MMSSGLQEGLAGGCHASLEMAPFSRFMSRGRQPRRRPSYVVQTFVRGAGLRTWRRTSYVAQNSVRGAGLRTWRRTSYVAQDFRLRAELRRTRRSLGGGGQSCDPSFTDRRTRPHRGRRMSNGPLPGRRGTQSRAGPDHASSLYWWLMTFRDRLIATIQAARPVLEDPGVLVVGSEVPNLLEPGAAARPPLARRSLQGEDVAQNFSSAEYRSSSLPASPSRDSLSRSTRAQ